MEHGAGRYGAGRTVPGYLVPGSKGKGPGKRASPGLCGIWKRIEGIPGREDYKMNLFQLAKAFEERAYEIEHGLHNELDKAERGLFMRDIAGAIYKYAHSQEKPFMVIRESQEGKDQQ